MAASLNLGCLASTACSLASPRPRSNPAARRMLRVARPHGVAAQRRVVQASAAAPEGVRTEFLPSYEPFGSGRLLGVGRCEAPPL
jgi:hypothetical protein